MRESGGTDTSPADFPQGSLAAGECNACAGERGRGLPVGVSVEPGRIEVRFSGAQDAVGRLFALAQALTNDYEQFVALVEAGEAAGGGGALRVEDEAV